MAADTNPELLPVANPSTGGYKLAYLIKKTAAGYLRGIFRGYGTTTAPNGANATSALMHLAVAETADDAWEASSIAVGTVAVRIDCTTAPLVNRKGLELYNAGPNDVVYYKDNTVVAGTPKAVLPARARKYFAFGENLAIWGICAASESATIRVEEYA